MEAGATGYLVKGMPQEMLVNAVKKVHGGGRYLPPPVSQALASRTRDSSLSPGNAKCWNWWPRATPTVRLARQTGHHRGHGQVPRERHPDAPGGLQATEPKHGYLGLRRGLIHL